MATPNQDDIGRKRLAGMLIITGIFLGAAGLWVLFGGGLGAGLTLFGAALFAVGTLGA